jgi:hypothetical protein
MIRDYCREKNIPVTDKKTVVRATQRLVSLNLLKSVTLSLDEAQSLNFHKSKEMEFLLLPDVEMEQVELYIASYNYIRPPGGKKKQSQSIVVESKEEMKGAIEMQLNPTLQNSMSESILVEKESVDEIEDRELIPKNKKRRTRRNKKVIEPENEIEAPTDIEDLRVVQFSFPEDYSLNFPTETLMEETVLVGGKGEIGPDDANYELPEDDHEINAVEETGIEKRERTKNEIWTPSEVKTSSPRCEAVMLIFFSIGL